MADSNTFFDGWEPFMVVGFKAYATDGTVRHREELEYTEDGRTISNLAGDADWMPVDGLSGQHGYSGPIMHPSEYLTAHTVSGLLDGLYQCVVVAYIGPCDDHGVDSCQDPICQDEASTLGWALMRYTGPDDEPEHEHEHSEFCEVYGCPGH